MQFCLKWIGALFALLLFFRDTGNAADTKGTGTIDPAFLRFAIEKEAFTRQIATRSNMAPRRVVWDFFAAAQRGDWTVSSNLFATIDKGSYRQSANAWLPPELWGPIFDVYGACEMFRSWHPDLLHRWGREVTNSIPDGSIYFGGSDAGRFIISALSKSHTAGKPFFTLTQNALADMTYLSYIRDLYGSRISIAGLAESQRAFQDYLDDAQQRQQRNELLEDEKISVIDGRVQVSGEVAVMMINQRLVQAIMEMNPGREFYFEESRAIPALYSNSTPHGLIFKLSPKPLPRISESAIEKDHRFWTEQVRTLLGRTAGESMDVTGLCAWAENIHVRSNLSQFAGDRLFLKDRQAPQYYSQCRSAIAYLYQWRSERNRAEADALLRESNFAHQQAVALSPYHPVVTGRYVDFLFKQQRTNDARALIRTTLKLEPEQRMDIDSDLLKKSLARLRTQAKEHGITAQP